MQRARWRSHRPLADCSASLSCRAFALACGQLVPITLNHEVIVKTTSIATLSALLVAAVLGAGAGFATWRFVLSEPEAGPEVVTLMPAVPPAPPPELIGTKATDFDLPGLDDNRYSLANWRGQVILLNFWATWCEPCREEMPMLVDMGNQLRERGFEVVGVAVDDPGEIKAFVDKFVVNFPIVYGEMDALKLSQQYGNRIGALPFTVIINRDGDIAFLKAGIVKKENVERVVLSLL